MPKLTRAQIQANLLELFDKEIEAADNAVPGATVGYAGRRKDNA